MEDVTTEKPLQVSTDGTAGPYIMVPVLQLNDVVDLLQSNRVYFEVDEDAISIDGKPEIAIVNLGRNGNAKAVQAILDKVH